MQDNPATNKPKRAAQVQVARTQTADGKPAYVLHNPDAHTYLQIDEQNYFLWELMDGEHDLAALAIAYMRQYGALPLDRLSQLISHLEASSLLEGAAPVPEQAPADEPESRMTRVAHSAFQRQFNWQGADRFFGAFYRRFGRVFFTRPALVVLALIAVIGFASFLYLHWAQDYRLFKVNNSYGAAIVVMFLASIVVVFLHESGHALTCKAFGRRIRQAGMMFYYGRPAFFVDASDMWMAARSSRIWVSLAGPAVNVLVGSLLAILALLLPRSTATEVLFVAAFVSYLHGLVNLNPLLELDGYYVLIDWLQTGQLRLKSFAFVRNDLLPKIRARARFTHEEITYGIYGVLAAAFTALTVLLGVYVWQRELRLMVRYLATGEDVLSMVLVGGLTLAASTWLVVGLVARFLVWVGARRQRPSPTAEGGDAAR
jgi:putative peptide zinc metalloprotease protein